LFITARFWLPYLISDYYFYILRTTYPSKMFNLNQSELEGKHIVVVDDDIPSAKYYETILRNQGAEITILKTGREFNDFISQAGGRSDIVILDFLIPFMNGVDCTRLFRREDKTTPVLMITAYCSDQIRRDAFIAGVDDFLLKPVMPEKLMLSIARQITRQKQVSV